MNRPVRRTLLLCGIAIALVVGAITGCSTIAYYSQAVSGHLGVMARARPVDTQLEDSSLSASLRGRLRAAVEIRDFASRALGLPDNGSYRSYADLGRPYALWSAFAAEPFSIKLKASCFPVAGCVSYRGFYSEQSANDYVADLRKAGLDVFVTGVAAYSTLGWFDDPLLNTFINYPNAELARLVFHELAHQVLYVQDDSMFNESFAVAVEEEGVARWLTVYGNAADRQAYEASRTRQRDFTALVLRYQRRLDALYQSELPLVAKETEKARLFGEMRADYVAMKTSSWGGYAGYDRWFAQELNNALLGSVGIYTELVPAFRALLARERGELPAFYRAARELGALAKTERNARLESLAGKN